LCSLHVVLHSTKKSALSVGAYISKIYYHTSFQHPKLCGISVASTSEVCAFAIMQ